MNTLEMSITSFIIILILHSGIDVPKPAELGQPAAKHAADVAADVAASGQSPGSHLHAFEPCYQFTAELKR